MKILMMSLIGSVGLFLGTANATPTDTADLAKDQTQVAKQGRGGDMMILPVMIMMAWS